MDFNTANKSNLNTAEKSSKNAANKASAISKKSVSGRLWIRKYIAIGLLVAVMVLTAVGFSKWNIHIQQEFGDTFIKYALTSYTPKGEDESQTTVPILEHFLTFCSGATDGSGSTGGSGSDSENATSVTTEVINTAKTTKDGISYYQLTYNGNTVGISVGDTYNTKKTGNESGSTGESGTGTSSGDSNVGALVGWDNIGLTFSTTYYKVTKASTTGEKSRALRTQTRASESVTYVEIDNKADNEANKPKNAGDYLCVLTANYQGNDETYINTVKKLNEAIENPAETKEKCAAAVYFTIEPKEIEIEWSDPTDNVYSGKYITPTAKPKTLYKGDSCNITVTTDNVDAGECTAIAISVDNSNYKLPTEADKVNYKFEIKPYTLQASDVKWGQLSFVYDGSIKTPTPFFDTFYNEKYGQRDTCTLDVTVENNKKDVGTYTAKVTGVSNSNYNTSSDTLTVEFEITKRSIVVAIKAATSVYGESVADFKSEVTSGTIVSDDKESDIFTLTSDVTNKSAVGSYDITGSTDNATNKNYEVTFTGGENAYTVMVRKIKVELMDKSHVYGSTPKTLEYTIENNNNPKLSIALADGDKASDVFRVYVANNNDAEITLQNNTAAGKYKIKCEKLEDKNNYEVTCSNEVGDSTYADYTVEKAPLTVTPIETTVSQGKKPDYKYGISGFVLNETQETITITGNVLFTSDYTGYPNEATKSGTFEFWIDARNSNLQATNYNFNYSDAHATLSVEENIIKIPVPKTFNVNFTYDGTQKSVTIQNLDIYTEYGQYIKFSELSGSITSATEAGRYTAQIALKTLDVKWLLDDGTLSQSNQKVEWTISPCKLHINDKVIEKNYITDGVLLSTDLFTGDNAITDGNSKTKNANDTPYTSVVTINYARNDLSLESSTQDDVNGKFYYLSGNRITVGSTYEIKLTLTDTENYVFDSDADEVATTTIVYLKYKTASVGGTLYTIEDALRATESGDIILKGGSPYVLTAFSKLELRSLSGSDFVNYNFSNGAYNYSLTNKDLILPYANGKNDVYIKNSENSVDAVYSVLVLLSDVTLNVTKRIKIAAYIAYSDYGWACATKDRGVVMNQGKINVKSGGAIDAYGYLKGEGMINLDSGATITDLFHMYGFGASLAKNLTDDNFFPISSYTLHNVSCKTTINKGATYSAYYCIEADGNYYDGKVEIISNTKNALFQLQEGYIEKSSDKASKWSDNSTEGKALKTINGSNQLPGQRDIIKMCNATVNDNAVAITLAYKLLFSTFEYTVKTSAKMACPIAYMDITVCNGSKLTLTSSSYKLYAGSTLTIDNGATLETSESISMLFLDVNQTNLYSYGPGFGERFSIVDSKPAQLIVNGNAYINGAVTGNITSSNASAIVSIGSNQATTVQVTAVNSTTTGVTVDIKTSDVMYAQGVQSDGGSVSTMAAGTYISVRGENGATCYWKLATDVKFVNFDYQGGNGATLTKVLLKNADGYYVLDKAPVPSARDHYEFGGWFTDTTYSTKVDPSENLNNTYYSNNNEITLYAKWTAETFMITYVNKGAAGLQVDESKITNANDKKYTYETAYSLKQPTANGYYFIGWFTDESCTKPITEIEFGVSGDLTLYALWTNVEPIKYTINLGKGDATDVTLSNESVQFDGLNLAGYDVSYTLSEITATWNGHEAVLNSDYMSNLSDILVYKHYRFKYYFNGWTLSYTSQGKSYTTEYETATPTIAFPSGATDIKLTVKWAEKAKLTIQQKEVKDTSINESSVYFKQGITIDRDTIKLICAAYAPEHYAFISYDVENKGEVNLLFESNEYTLTAYYKRYYHFILSGDYNNVNVAVSEPTNMTSVVDNSKLEVWIEPSITEMTIDGKTGVWERYIITACAATKGTTLPNGVTIPTLIDNSVSLAMSFANADSLNDICLTVTTKIQYYVKLTANKDDKHDVTWVTGEDGWYDEGTTVKVKLSAGSGFSKTIVKVYNKDDEELQEDSVTGDLFSSKTKDMTITVTSGCEIRRV